MISRRQHLCCYICLLLVTSVLTADQLTTTTRAPSRRYPVRTFLGNMYHRFRNNKAPMILIPPLLRLAYQFGGPLLERMGSALGLSASSGASAVDGIVDSAISGALSGGAASAAAPIGQLPFAGIPPGIGGFGAAPIGAFGGLAGRPVFFRRR